MKPFLRALATAFAITAAIPSSASAREISAFARPGTIYAGQDFEICYDIHLTQLTDLSLQRPTGLPDQLELGQPRGEGVVSDAETTDGGRDITVRVSLPAFCPAAMRVVPAQSTMALDLVERVRIPFGTSTRSVRQNARISWTPFEIRPLPEEGRPDGFSGAIGRFSLDSSLPSHELAVGDIARWELTLSGSGRLNGAEIKPPSLDPRFFKVYPAEQPQTRDGILAAAAFNVIPVSTQAVEIAEASFGFFNPETGHYETAVAPAIPVSVSERSKDAPVEVKTIDLASRDSGTSVSTNSAETVQLLLAPSANSLKTRQVPRDALQTLEAHPGGLWIRVRDAHSGHTGWMRRE